MGVSFKISKRGTKFKPKPVISESTLAIDDGEHSLETSRIPSKHDSDQKDEDAVGLSGSSLSSERHHISAEGEVSFILNLYPDGYSIGKPSENDSGLHAGFQEGSKILHPYDRTSEVLFTVRDYRKGMSDSTSNVPSSNGPATINKVHLKMSLENVVKDIPLMADDSWTYGDLMEVESRILKALQPKLCLDPVPKLDRLCKNPVSLKLDLGLRGSRKRRMRQIPEVTVTSNNRPHGKKICIDRAPESSSYRIGEVGPTSGDLMSQHIQDNVSVQGLGNQRNMHDPVSNAIGASPAGQDMPISYADMSTSVLGKLEGQEVQLSQYSNLSKRARVGSVGPDGVQHQQIGSFMDGLQASDVQWRNQFMQQPPNARGIQYPNAVLQRYPQLGGEGINNQDGVKLEKADPNVVKTDMQMMEAENGHIDPRLQQRFQQHPLLRSTIQQASWNNLSQQVEKDFKKEEQFPKRKSIQSPRFSAGAVPQSPLTAKYSEMSCNSMGTPYGAIPSAATLGQLQREKSAVTSIPAGYSTSITSSANDSMQSQHQAQLAAKRRSNSLPKTPVISGVGSPVSVNNMGGPMNASSPSVSTPQLGDQNMLEKFAKIEVVAMRHQLNRKKNKVDEYPRRSRPSSSQELQLCLSNASNYEYSKDEISTSLSKSLVGGSMNACKIRIVTVQPQANMLSVPVRTRLILSEKPNDGTVAMHYGDLEVADCLNAEDHLPALPNTHLADLLAVQFCALMNREGYFTDDQVQLRPPRNTVPSNSQPNAPAVTPNNSVADMQHPESESNVFDVTTAISVPTFSPHVANKYNAAIECIWAGCEYAIGMMMGLGPAMGMGNIGNMGLGGLGNVMGIGGARGMSASGISAPVGPISGIGGNMGQNPLNMSQANAISQHLRAGTFTPQQAHAALLAQRLKMMQSRGMMGGTQSGMTEATSPLQAVVSPPQVGSPSTLGIPQQMNQQVAQQQASPQQMGQRTPMSPPLSSGPMHPMSTGNPEACPASPALSSQTLGSVGSITNSSMDLQGVNKSNSVTNT
uniref:Uncharacterized protein n=1 Tax=Chenopodium quinoa TaxID=63459 RepID=A0A803KQY6_CHEQI